MKLSKQTIQIFYTIAIILIITASTIVILSYFGVRPNDIPAGDSIISSGGNVLTGGCQTYTNDCTHCGSSTSGGQTSCDTCEICSGDFTCDNSAYVRCGETNTCGPSSAWCDNFLSGDKSCNSDKSRCCNNAGDIYAFNYNVCCPPTDPFTPDGKLCYKTYQSGSDNFFTRSSDCTPGQNKCDGYTYSECTTNNYISQYQTKGIIKGKCEVQCQSDTDCSLKQNSSNLTCNGKDIVQPYTAGRCSNSMCAKDNLNDTIKTCDYNCSNGTCTSNLFVYLIGAVILVFIAGLIYFIWRFYFRKK